MSKFDKVPVKKKIFKAQHLEPGAFFMDYILLPIGFAYNAEWMKAKKGDRLRFHDGGLYRIRSVRIVKVHGGLADILSRMRYGITIRGCMQRWKMNAKLEGHTSKAVSEDECLWVVYEKEPEEGVEERAL